MNAHDHSRSAHNVHEIPKGSPLGFATFDVSSVLERSAEEKLLDYAREYESTLRFYLAASDAEDRAMGGSEAKDRARLAGEHAARMMEAIEANAYAVPATTAREVALKARIFSGAKREFWDHSHGERDADLRFLIEDALALGGLDRIKLGDVTFATLLPGYDGPERTEAVASTKEERQTSPQSCPQPQPMTIHALAVEAHDLWELYSRIDASLLLEKKMPTTLENNLETVRDRINSIESQVSYMRATSLADAVFQVAVIHENLYNAAERDTTESRAIERMIASVALLLLEETGLSLEAAGVDAYLKNMLKAESKSLAQRFDPGRFGAYDQVAA